METYIVRIYLRRTTPRQEPAGTVERVGSRDRLGFASRKELLDRLLEPARTDERGSKPAETATRRRR